VELLGDFMDPVLARMIPDLGDLCPETMILFLYGLSFCSESLDEVLFYV